MPSNVMIILVAAELALLCLAICLFLAFKNHALKKLIDRLKTRMEELVADLKKARANKQVNAPVTTQEIEAKSYMDWIAEQIDSTHTFHRELKSPQDIVLDIAPDSPLPNRTAALRNAIMLAEKEAFAQNHTGLPNWHALQHRYEKIFNFYNDFTGDNEDSIPADQLDTLNEELTNARKRINNLEKFKNLYFELEEKWQNCKDEAQTHFTSLSRMAEQVDDPEAFEQTLDSYHASYNQISTLIESNFEDSISGQQSINGNDANGEIKHLKQVAAEQHQVITDLQRKLQNTDTPEEVRAIVSNLEEQLNQQMRFVKESETCVQLMEDELQNAHSELDQLRSRLSALPQIKTQLIGIRKERDEYELKMHALGAENRKLKKQIQASGSSKDDAVETIKLRKALSNMEARYNDLEEKFLDLKLQKNN